MPGLIERTVSTWPGGVVRPSRSLKWIVPLMPGHRPERRREVEVGGREIAGRGDLAAGDPVDPALAADRAVDERDHAFGQAA